MAGAARTRPSQQDSMFLRLPKECRDIIYGHLLVSTTPVRWPNNRQHCQMSPDVLRVCRQIHQEAVPVLYKSNTLLFAHPSDCNVFRRIMDQTFSKSISRVVFCVRARYFDKIWRSYLTNRWQFRSLAQDLPNLKSLNFVLEGSSWQSRRHPEENLQEWFNREVAFQGLCQALDIHQDHTDPHKVPADIKITCRQRIPQVHFDQLRRLTLTEHEGQGRSSLLLASETCLRMPPGGKIPEFVSLELLAPADNGAV